MKFMNTELTILQFIIYKFNCNRRESKLQVT